MQYSVRFFVSWIVAAVFMYSAFYAWHGLFLNDLNSLSISKPVFFGLAALVYLAISYVLYRAFYSKLTAKITSNVLRAILIGTAFGFMIFAMITVLGISFTKNVTFTYLVADCIWQLVEQCVGCLVICVCHFLIFEPGPEFLEQNQS